MERPFADHTPTTWFLLQILIMTLPGGGWPLPVWDSGCFFAAADFSAGASEQLLTNRNKKLG
jgi:hypothetical protein